MTNDTHPRRREAPRDAHDPVDAPSSGQDAKPTAPRRALGKKLEAALRKAYARDDLRLHGVASASVQTLARLGLAEVAARGRFEHYALSEAGERRAAELTRALLAQREAADPGAAPGPRATMSSADAAGKAVLYDRLTAFFADPSSGTLTLELPSPRDATEGMRVKIDRCGPSKLVVGILYRSRGR